MTRCASISKVMLTIIVAGFLAAGQPFVSASAPMSETAENQVTAAGDDSKDLSSGQVGVQLSQDEIASIAAALPEGQVRQMFEKKSASAAQKDKPKADEEPVTGEEISTLFFEGEKAFSKIQEQIRSFFAASTYSSREWETVLENLSEGKGYGHLMLTLLIAALLILIGLTVEWLVRRPTEGLRRQILDTASLGRLQILGRVFSRLLLNLFGLGIYTLTTFVLFAFFYDEGASGFLIVAFTLVLSYYLRLAVLAANFMFSPAAPALRLLPLQDNDAKFLYRWIIRITATMMVLGTISYTFKWVGGVSQEIFRLMYGLSGFSVALLLVVMIWRSRRRLARAIWSGDLAGGEAKTSLRARFAKSWHYFATFGVMVMGIFWFGKGQVEERNPLIPLIVSIYLVPLFIGLKHWAERLLNIAAGLAPSPFAPQWIDGPEAGSELEANQIGESQDRQADKTFYLRQHLPLIRNALRILLAALFFFLILSLWGIDLPVGRLFTSTALNILGLVLLGLVVWQFTKARIDRKIREEMPDDDEEMEEGGRGGSRVGTLLVLLRKFVLSVLFVVVSLIILSSLGLNIGPLIAGAGVIGLAIGFGSQTLVRDILSGVFFLIDDAFRVGDYIETGGTKGMVEYISLRSLKLRHPRGMVFTIPFGDMGAVQNFSRDYIITKLDIRVRYDADIDKIRKIVKKINKELEKNEEIGPVLLSPIKSQGVREMDDSAMILRVKFKTIPGEQFVVRREVYKRIQEFFREEGIEFAHRNVTVYLPPEVTGAGSAEEQQNGSAPGGTPDKKLFEAGAAAAVAASQADEAEKKSKK